MTGVQTCALPILLPISSNKTHNREFQKNSKKIQKIKEHHYGFFSSQNRLEKAEKEGKYKLWFRSLPTRPIIENSKKIAKKFKILKNTITYSFHAKIGRKIIRNRENKNYRSVPFLTRYRKF